MKLEVWTAIKKQFGTNPNLLLGNGASIAIDKRLSYRSLYDKVCSSGKLPDDLLKMFKYFKTSNFEFIMRLLLEASQVNKALKIDHEKPRAYYYKIRDALIETVRDIHPNYPEVQHILPSITDFLQGFRTVVSLNYDLLVYWALLVGNTSLECQWFKDCFIAEGKFEKDFDYLHRPQQPAKGATLVFYPHGSLFLATDIMGDETKLCRSENVQLLEVVLQKWKDADYIPLFVSEGVTSEKFRAITRSTYLNTVYDSVLRKLSGALVIYGWSFSEQDGHILEAIDNKNIRMLGISVHTQNPEWEQYCEMVKSKIAQTHRLKDAKVLFFDAASKGCWIY